MVSSKATREFDRTVHLVSPRANRLDEVPPDEVLRRIRRRKRAGLPMTSTALNGEDLLNLARFHFGGWYEAVAAAGVKPRGRPTENKAHVQGHRRLRTLTEPLLLGPLSSSELERVTGVRADTIRHRRRRMGIRRDERRRRDRSWLPVVRELLGTRPDTEIAKGAGVSPNTIARARRELGIPAFVPDDRPPEGDLEPLDHTPPEEVLRRIRARARSGKSMGARRQPARLRALADFHFGGWYEAVKAAGLKPEGSSKRREVASPKRLRKLTRALLEGPLPSRELERLTGVPRKAIRERREGMGIHRDERPKADRAWVVQAYPLMGKIPDAEIARRLNVSPQLLGRVRKDLGIKPCPPSSLAASEELRQQLQEYNAEEIEAALKKVGRKTAVILRRRVLASTPETLERLGARFGITRQSVRLRERRGLIQLLADLEQGLTGR